MMILAIIFVQMSFRFEVTMGLRCNPKTGRQLVGFVRCFGKAVVLTFQGIYTSSAIEDLLL